MHRPFDHISPEPSVGLASTAYVERRVREELQALHFTGDGIEISTSAPGQVHLRSTGSGGGSAPFAVSISDGLATIAAGTISTHLYGQSPSFYRFSPSDTEVAVASNATGYILLRMHFSKATGNVQIPWNFVFATEPSETNLRRALGSDAGRDGVIDLPIARIKNGAVAEQYVTSHIAAQASWNTIFITRQP